MFRIKGQVQSSHLSNMQAYRPKSHFRDKGHTNTFILPNTKPNRVTFHISHQGTCSNFPFIKVVGKSTKISFSRQSHSNTFILPNTKPNTIETKSFQFFHLSNLQAHIDQNLIFANRVNSILSFYQIQNQIGSHIMFATRNIKGQVQTSHLSKLQANRPKSYFRDKVIPILSFYRIQNQILS